jgi:hypothetical protein
MDRPRTTPPPTRCTTRRSSPRCRRPRVSPPAASRSAISVEIGLIAEDLALTGLGEDDELVAEIAADGAGIGEVFCDQAYLDMPVPPPSVDFDDVAGLQGVVDAWTSPVLARMMNSWLRSPPMGPVSARIGIARRPSLSKVRR